MLLMVSAPMLLTVLVVGLVVSIFQAATQINEATLSFVPKIVAAVAVLAVAGPWMLTTLVEYLQRTLQSIPQRRRLTAAAPAVDADLHRSRRSLAWVTPLLLAVPARRWRCSASLPVLGAAQRADARARRRSRS